MSEELQFLNTEYEQKYGFKEDTPAVFSTNPGVSEDVVRQISQKKNEPEWMLDFRLKAFKMFLSKPMPKWGANLSVIDFDKIIYYLKPSGSKAKSWDDVPEKIKNTFERLGIPEAERKFLGGVGAQYESETVYHKLREDLEKKGVVFLDTDTALKTHPELFKQWFGKVVPPGDNKFAALNTAVWSGGTFIYIPQGVHVDIPLQAYFRINAQNMGQFERTLIIVDKDASVHYIEGCTAPIYSTDSLHSAVVELVALPGAKIRYTTIQNWSSDVYNLVTKRAFAYENSIVEWIDG
ncbi:MAG: Fe-S cluster assembly protein SufB, partial [Candidatus Woesearchaeota archaeon]|nr:Fe-S cluster assembly protein SufB [Candidatus Woesearchaeota archaeon]